MISAQQLEALDPQVRQAMLSLMSQVAARDEQLRAEQENLRRLQAQTNVSAGIGTNWVPVGTTSNRLQIVPVTGSVFFRLVTP